jgi:hypothetical protein
MFNFLQPGFKLATGVHVTNMDGISEGYSINRTEQNYYNIVVNVSAENLEEIYLGLCSLVNPPAFGLVELPTNKGMEEKLRTKDTDPLHCDVYYSDGMSLENHIRMFKTFTQFFVNDGQICYGYGSHRGFDEVYVGRYKLFSIIADNPEKYVKFLEKHHYEHRNPLRTVFDNFTQDTPGLTESIKVGGKTVYDLLEVLLANGFYFAEHRPS